MFWKCRGRRIYAFRVNSNILASLKRSAKLNAKAISSSYYDVSNDSHEDPTPKRSRGVNHGDMQIVNSQINGVKSMVCDILKSCPCRLIGVVKVLRDIFMCKICHAMPMKAPVNATNCCNTLLDCKECVMTWFDGADVSTRQ